MPARGRPHVVVRNQVKHREHPGPRRMSGLRGGCPAWGWRRQRERAPRWPGNANLFPAPQAQSTLRSCVPQYRCAQGRAASPLLCPSKDDPAESVHPVHGWQSQLACAPPFAPHFRLPGLAVPVRSPRSDRARQLYIHGCSNAYTGTWPRDGGHRCDARKDDRRISSRMGRGVANSCLAAWRIAWRNGESVLSFGSEVLTLMLRCGGVPDLARK